MSFSTLTTQPPILSSSRRNSSTSFNDLPVEIQILIFQRLPLKDRFCFQSVCYRWQPLLLKDVTELAVKPKELEFLDRHLLMTNHIIIDNIWLRFEWLEYCLKKFNSSLKRLHLSFLHENKRKFECRQERNFYMLYHLMIKRILDCQHLTAIFFDL